MDSRAHREGDGGVSSNRGIGIEEKPKLPKSTYAFIGIYLYDASVFQKIRRLTPSARGELEISDAHAHAAPHSG